MRRHFSDMLVRKVPCSGTASVTREAAVDVRVRRVFVTAYRSIRYALTRCARSSTAAPYTSITLRIMKMKC